MQPKYDAFFAIYTSEDPMVFSSVRIYLARPIPETIIATFNSLGALPGVNLSYANSSELTIKMSPVWDVLVVANEIKKIFQKNNFQNIQLTEYSRRAEKGLEV